MITQLEVTLLVNQDTKSLVSYLDKIEDDKELSMTFLQIIDACNPESISKLHKILKQKINRRVREMFLEIEKCEVVIEEKHLEWEIPSYHHTQMANDILYMLLNGRENMVFSFLDVLVNQGHYRELRHTSEALNSYKESSMLLGNLYEANPVLDKAASFVDKALSVASSDAIMYAINYGDTLEDVKEDYEQDKQDILRIYLEAKDITYIKEMVQRTIVVSINTKDFSERLDVQYLLSLHNKLAFHTQNQSSFTDDLEILMDRLINEI